MLFTMGCQKGKFGFDSPDLGRGVKTRFSHANSKFDQGVVRYSKCGLKEILAMALDCFNDLHLTE